MKNFEFLRVGSIPTVLEIRGFKPIVYSFKVTLLSDIFLMFVGGCLLSGLVVIHVIYTRPGLVVKSFFIVGV